MKFYYLFLLFVITACNVGGEVTTEENVQNLQTETREAISDVGESKLEIEEEDPDSLLVPPFAIHFDFSEKVQKVLDSGKERLIIDIILSGQPKDKAALGDKDYYSDEDEIVYLKNVEIVYEQNEAQTFTIENLKISKEALKALEDPNYMIAIGFYSSRTSSDNNIFDTDGLMEEVNIMKNKTHKVKVNIL